MGGMGFSLRCAIGNLNGEGRTRGVGGDELRAMGVIPSHARLIGNNNGGAAANRFLGLASGS